MIMLSETYVEYQIDDKVIFRIDPHSEYGFFYNSITGDLYLSHPILKKFVSEEIKQQHNITYLHQMLKNVVGSDDCTKPSLYQINLLVTEKCNLSCLHCWISAKAVGREMTVPLDQILSVIKQAIPMGLRRIGITGGEPLTWRTLPKLIEAISRKGLSIYIDTNGTLLDRDTAAILADHDVYVGLSVDSHLDYLHDHLRGVPGAFKKALKALDLLNDFSVPYGLSTCVCKENYLYMKEFFQWCHQIGVKTVKLNPIVAWGRGSKLSEKGLLLDTKELFSLANLISRTNDISINPSLPPCLFSLDFNYHRMNTSVCDLKNVLSIKPDGHLSICGPGYYQTRVNLGRLDENLDLADLWTTHPFLLKIRQENRQNMAGICGNCIFSKSCFGFCKVLTYDVTNSWVAPYPLCQQLYETKMFPEIYIRERQK